MWAAKAVKEEDIGFLLFPSDCAHCWNGELLMSSVPVNSPPPRFEALCPDLHQSVPHSRDLSSKTKLAWHQWCLNSASRAWEEFLSEEKRGKNVSVPRWHLRHTPAHCPEGSRFVLICGKAGFRWQKWPAGSKHTASDLQICTIPRAGKKPNWFFTLWGNKEVDLKAIM